MTVALVGGAPPHLTGEKFHEAVADFGFQANTWRSANIPGQHDGLSSIFMTDTVAIFAPSQHLIISEYFLQRKILNIR